MRELRRHLGTRAAVASTVTPFTRNRWLAAPVFGVRIALACWSSAASVAWYRHWHEVFLRRALRSHLAGLTDCVIYAQDPLAARAALRTRRGSHQRVVMAVHFRTSQADEWAGKGQITTGGRVYRSIRRVERQTIPRVDALVYVSRWAREALGSWLPHAAAVPHAVIGNFTAPAGAGHQGEPLGDLVTTGHLEPVKNHRFLLEVLAAARERGAFLTLDIYGDGPLRHQLEQQARSLNVERQVRFRGFQPGVRNYLGGYRAYVHASYSESSSLAIIEAMAAGLPIVAGDVGPIRELCDDGVEARFWPLDHPGAAAAVVADLLGNSEARRKAARAARDRFARDFDANVIGPRLLSFLLGS